MIFKKINGNNPLQKEIRFSQIENGKAAQAVNLYSSKGPFKIINVCGPKGIGVEPIYEKHKSGFWFIGLPPESKEIFWYRTGHTQEELNQLCGLTEESYIGRLFYVEPNGLAYLMDQSGNGFFPGETNDRPSNMFPATVPLTIGGLSGIRFPGISDVMSLLRKAK